MWPQELREMLVATLLRHQDDVVEAIIQHPNADHGEDGRQHTFINRIRDSLSYAEVEEDTFCKQKKEVRDGFFECNLMAIPNVA